MTDQVRKKIIIKTRTVVLTMALVFAVVSVAFGYSFYNPAVMSMQPVSGATGSGAPVFNRMIYAGFEKDAFNKPMDVAQIGQLIYVSDTNNKRVQVFDLGGTPAYKFGSEGDQPGQFRFPYGISGDSQGNVYVADLFNGCISVFDSKGKFLRYFAEQKPSEKVIASPGGLRIVNNQLYVTDIQQNKVMVFDLNGKKLLEIGKVGVKGGEFRAPNSVTADKEGKIYVTDSGNQRVQIFDKTGKFLSLINGTPGGLGASVFVNPRGVALDSQGRIYVLSNLTHFLYCYDQKGVQQFVLGGYGDGVDKLTLPNGLYINENDEIYITDTMNQRVAVYQ